jgi:hypothetical protein
MDFEKIFIFYKTHKNSYMGTFGTTDPEYGSYDTEIQSFRQFLPKMGDFLLNRSLNTRGFWVKIWFFYKIHKNFYTGPLGISDREYRGHNQEIPSFDQFYPKTHEFL